MSRPFPKNYAAQITATWEEHGAIDRAIAAIQNVYDMKRWDAISYLFKIGAEVGLKHVEDESERQNAHRVLIKSKLLDVIRAESKHDDEIRKGMSELGMERIISSATANGLDESIVRDILERIKMEMPLTNIIAQWLEDYMSDYKPHKTEEVKREAIKNGLLPLEDDPSFEGKWATVRVVANRVGLSGGKYGEWQKKLL